MKLPFFLILWMAVSLGAVEINMIPINGKNVYRLSNARVEVDVQPDAGGRIVRLYDKAGGRNVTVGLPLSAAPAGSGLLNDRIQSISGVTVRDYETSSYKVVSAKKNGASAELVLRAERKPLTIEKRIVLTGDEGRVEVFYALENPSDKDFTGSFWGNGIMAVRPGSAPEIYYPAGKYNQVFGKKTAASRLKFDDSIAEYNHFVYEPERDYVAVFEDGHGAVMSVPFEYLDRFYTFFGKGKKDIPTVEWFTRPFRLPPLAKGIEYARTHPELQDPLTDFIYRFKVEFSVIDGDFNYNTYRPEPATGKSKRFLFESKSDKAYTEFKGKPIFELQPKAAPLKMLAILPWEANFELYEFNRRLKSDLETVELEYITRCQNSAPTMLLAGWYVPGPAKALAKALEKRYDLILISGLFQQAVPKELVEKLVAQVREGTSVLYISQQNNFPALISGKGEAVPEVLNKGIPWQFLPFRHPELTCYRLGKGHVYFVRMDLWKGGYPYMHGSHAVVPRVSGDDTESLKYWECAFAYLARIIEYAAAEKKPVAITSCAPENGILKFNFDNSGTPLDARLEIRADGPGKIETIAMDVNIANGHSKLDVPIPGYDGLPNGKYLFSAMLSNRNTTLDWYMAAVDKKAAAGIDSIQTDKYSFANAEAVTGKINIRGKGKLTLRILDDDGRAGAERVVEKASGPVAFSLENTLRSHNPLMVLEAVLDAEGTTVETRRITFTQTPLPQDRLRFVLWGSASDDWITQLLDEKIAEIGFDVCTGYTPELSSAEEQKRKAESIFRSGMIYSPISFALRFAVSPNKLKSVKRDPCLRDPEYLGTVRKTFAAIVNNSLAYQTPVYYSGDENSLGHYMESHDFCQSKWCLAHFRAALKKKYGSIDALNRIWKTDYRDFDSVMPYTLKEAAAKNNYIPWFEHRLAMFDNLTDVARMMRQELKQLAPNTKLAISGQTMTDLNTAFDWFRTLPYFECPTAYFGPTSGLPDIIRSYGTPDVSAGNWCGYGVANEKIRFAYWNNIINGLYAPGFWWYAYLIRRGDGNLSETGKFIQSLISDIRFAGADRLLVDSARVPSPFTVVYSVPSLIITGETGARELLLSNTVMGDNFHGWAGLIRDAGFPPPQVLSSDDLGKITPETHRVVVLAMAQVLSDKQISILEKYVENGGILIADTACGTYDEFGRRRGTSPMNRLFGIEPAPNTDVSGATVSIAGSNISALPAPETVSAVSAKPLGAISSINTGSTISKFKIAPSHKKLAPAALINSIGKGKTLYLNFLLNEYPSTRQRESVALPFVNAVRELFAQCGVASPHILPCGTTLSEYANQGNRYFALVRAGNDSKGNFSLDFGKASEVYDVRKHQYLGRMNKLSGIIAPDDAAVFAVTEKKIDSFTVAVTRDGRFFKLNMNSDGACSVVRVEVFRNGKPVRELTGNHNVDGTTVLTLDAGINPRGKWDFRITNLFNGTIVNETLEIL